MLLPYWDYYVEKNWGYELYPEIINSNVFCYGRPNSGRTEKVVLPIAIKTIEENRSCVIYAEHANNKYGVIRGQALRRNYTVYELEASEIDTCEESCIVEEINKSVLQEKPTLVLISDKEFNIPFRQTIVDSLLEKLYACKEWEPGVKIKTSHRKSTQIVLDNLNGNLVLDPDMLKAPHLRFCITMGSQIAYLPWLQKTTKQILECRLRPTEQMKQVIGDVLAPMAVQRFFYNIETVICTGVNGVKPEMHREFVGGYMFDIPTIRIGGRFVIMQNQPNSATKKHKCIFPSTGRKIAIDEETIETSTYGELASDYIRRGRWILEQNGNPHLYFDGTIYCPAIFSTKEGALDWLSVKIQNEKMKVTHFEEKEGMIQCDCFNNNTKTEFFLTFITKEDEEAFQMAYLLRVLEMAEREDLIKWLKTDEAIKLGYDPKEDIETNIEKYYAALEDNNLNNQTTASQETPERADAPSLLPIEPYWAKYQGTKEMLLSDVEEQVVEAVLPEDGVLFLGGHRNMVKKIKPLHPRWLFITDDQLIRTTSAINVKFVFYWTKHSSHKMMENVFSKLAPGADIIYVTATNVDRLEGEMLEKYIENKNRARRENK